MNASRSFTMDEAPRRQRRESGEQARIARNRTTRESRIVETQPMGKDVFRVQATMAAQTREAATICYFNPERGFGFLQIDAGRLEYFFHCKDARGVPEDRLVKGTRVVCSVQPAVGTRKPFAVGVEEIAA